MPENVGLSAKLKFEGDQAIAGMRKTSSAFDRVATSAKRVKAGMAGIRKGFSGAGIATAALTAGVVKTVKDFADFDFQVTKAISLTKDGAENMDQLRRFAKKMGAETFFTAKQSAEGMEALARAGLSANEIMAALPTVLNLAAAESLDLKRATEIVVKASGQFGIGMQEAEKITDILAFTSKNTATDINQLAEGLKFVGTKAGRSMNITMQQTVGVLGLLSNVAADASVGGTTLNNALIKIGQNAERGRVKVGKVSATIVKTFDPKTGKRGVDLVETMRNIANAASSIKDPIQRAAALTDLLGIRGEKAALAFSAAFSPDKAKETEKFLTQLQGNIKGTATALAKAQIDTVAGQYKIFGSAVEGVSVSLGKMILQGTPLIPFMQRVTATFGDAASALAILTNRAKPGTAAFKQQSAELSKLGNSGVQLAHGLIEAFEGVKTAFSTFGTVVKGVGSVFGVNFGDGSVRSIVRLTAKTLAWVTVLKIAGGTLGRMFSIAKGGFDILRGGFGIFSGLLGRAGGKAAGLSKLAAQPVRVVNFDEAGGMLGGGKGAGGAAGAAAGPLGKLAAAAKTVAGVAGVGIVASKIGEAAATAKLEAVQKARSAYATASQTALASGKNLIAQAAQLRQLRAAGVTKFEATKGKRVELTQQTAIEALRDSALRQGLTAKQFEAMIPLLTSVLSTLEKGTTVKNTVVLDGRVVSQSDAKAKEEQDQRLGKKAKPGEKRRARVR